jgi:hypothetical protein
MASPIRPGSRSTDTAIAEVSIEEVYRCYLAFHDLALGLHRADLAHMLVLCEPLSVAGEAPMIAASIAAAASLTIEPVPAAVRHSTRSGAIDFTVNNLDEALRALKNEIRKGLSIAICLEGNQYQILLHMVERGVQPDVVCSAGPVRLEVRPFLERGARLVDPNSASLAADQVATTWSVPDLPGKWLPLVDEIVAGCLPPEDHLRRTWLKRAPRYLGRAMRVKRYLPLTSEEAQRIAEAFREETQDPRWDGLRVEFKAKNWDAIFARNWNQPL